MTDYISNTTLPVIAQRLKAAGRILLTTHVKPDGDALGSVLALHRALTPKGADLDIYLMGSVEANLAKLISPTPVKMIEHDPPDDGYDCIVVADTGAWTQLAPVESWLRERRDRIIVIDHHSRGDDVGALLYVDSDAASTTQIILELLDELNADITGEIGGIGEALFLGLATDTGWFKYGNAGADAFRVAARLLDLGVDKQRLYDIIEHNYRPARLAIQSRALKSIELIRDGAVSIMSLMPEDFRDTGATMDDLTGLVNDPLTLGSVCVSILLAQIEPGVTKVSLRSNPARPGDADDLPIDVNRLAQTFGGGGHTHAAGARLAKDLPQAREDLLQTVG